MSETAAHRAAQAVEYGQYRATQQIHVDGVLAFNPGAAVPASNVETHGYFEAGLVERVGDSPAPETAPSGSVELTKGAGKRTGSEG